MLESALNCHGPKICILCCQHLATINALSGVWRWNLKPKFLPTHSWAKSLFQPLKLVRRQAVHLHWFLGPDGTQGVGWWSVPLLHPTWLPQHWEHSCWVEETPYSSVRVRQMWVSFSRSFVVRVNPDETFKLGLRMKPCSAGWKWILTQHCPFLNKFLTNRIFTCRSGANVKEAAVQPELCYLSAGESKTRVRI